MEVLVILYGAGLYSGVYAAVDRLFILVVEDKDITGSAICCDPVVEIFFGYLFYLLELGSGDRSAYNEPSFFISVCESACEQGLEAA